MLERWVLWRLLCESAVYCPQVNLTLEWAHLFHYSRRCPAATCMPIVYARNECGPALSSHIFIEYHQDFAFTATTQQGRVSQKCTQILERAPL